MQPLAGLVIPPSPSSETVDEADSLYEFHSTTPTPTSRLNPSPTSTGSNLSSPSLNELEPSPSILADSAPSFSVAHFVQNDLSDSFALLDPDDRASSSPLEEQLPEDLTLASDTTELDHSFSYNYIPDWVQSPRTGRTDPSAYTLSSLYSHLSSGANNIRSDSCTPANTLRPIVHPEFRAMQRSIPPLRSLDLPWNSAQPEGHTVRAHRSGILPLRRNMDEDDEETTQDSVEEVESPEEHMPEAHSMENQMPEDGSEYQADFEDAA